jgi:regulator of cell morphogenesis and NO signaling
MAATLSSTLSLADLVVEEPSRSRVFERFGLDYCCGGGHTLEEACRKRGIPVAEIVAALQAPGAPSEHDWASASVDELVDHIVDVHHAYLRDELPRLSRLLAEVARAHGSQDARLVEVSATFETLRTELESHLTSEEDEAFPAFRAAAEGSSFVLMDVLEHDHAEVGRLLGLLSGLTSAYDQARAHCGTHRAALDGLRELTLDLHQHIHEENNILFPRVRALIHQ